MTRVAALLLLVAGCATRSASYSRAQELGAYCAIVAYWIAADTTHFQRTYIIQEAASNGVRVWIDSGTATVRLVNPVVRCAWAPVSAARR